MSREQGRRDTYAATASLTCLYTSSAACRKGASQASGFVDWVAKSCHDQGDLTFTPGIDRAFAIRYMLSSMNLQKA